MQTFTTALLTVGLAFSVVNIGYAESNTGTGSPVTPAEHNEGTGSPTLQLALTEDQRVLMQVNTSQTLISGSAITEQGYGYLPLDAYDNNQGQLYPNWGQAEVLLGCGSADVIIYQNIDGHSVEVGVGTVSIPQCVE